MITRDQLVEALRLHRGPIVEADEWRPLADHVLELVEHGLLRPSARAGEAIEAARAWLHCLAERPEHFGQKHTALRALDALAREPELRDRIVKLEGNAALDEARIAAVKTIHGARIAELEAMLKETPFTCPVCNGAKTVSRPPGVPGDVPSWGSTSCASYECPVCKGVGVLWGSDRYSAMSGAVSRERGDENHVALIRQAMEEGQRFFESEDGQRIIDEVNATVPDPEPVNKYGTCLTCNSALVCPKCGGAKS